VNDKVDQFVSEHDLCVEVGDQEADVITLDLFPSENDEVLGPSHHELGELVAQQFLDLVRLLDCNGYSNRVNGRFYEYPLLLVPGDNHWVQQQLWRLPNLNFWFVVALDLLRAEVLEAHGRLQGPLHAGQVGLQGRRHFVYSSASAFDRPIFCIFYLKL